MSTTRNDIQFLKITESEAAQLSVQLAKLLNSIIDLNQNTALQNNQQKESINQSKTNPRPSTNIQQNINKKPTKTAFSSPISNPNSYSHDSSNQRFIHEALAYAFIPEYDQKAFMQWLSTNPHINKNILSESELLLNEYLDEINFPNIQKLQDNLFLKDVNNLGHFQLKQTLLETKKSLNFKKPILNLQTNKHHINENFGHNEFSRNSDYIDDDDFYGLYDLNTPKKYHEFYNIAFQQNIKLNTTVSLLNNTETLLKNQFQNKKLAENAYDLTSPDTGKYLSSQLNFTRNNLINFYTHEVIDFNIINHNLLSAIPFDSEGIDDFVNAGITEAERLLKSYSNLLNREFELVTKNNKILELTNALHSIEHGDNLEMMIKSQSFYPFDIKTFVDENSRSPSNFDLGRKDSDTKACKDIVLLMKEFINLKEFFDQTILSKVLYPLNKVAKSVNKMTCEFSLEQIFYPYKNILQVHNIITKFINKYNLLFSSYNNYMNSINKLHENKKHISSKKSGLAKLLLPTDKQLLSINQILLTYKNLVDNCKNIDKMDSVRPSLEKGVFMPFSKLVDFKIAVIDQIQKSQSDFVDKHVLFNPDFEIGKTGLEISNFLEILRTPLQNINLSNYESSSMIPLHLYDKISQLKRHAVETRKRYKTSEKLLANQQTKHQKVLSHLFSMFYASPLQFSYQPSTTGGSIKVLKDETDVKLIDWIQDLEKS
ncbi:hypothetical protein BB559_000270 [Furculomyces boomerangus]|uniref:Uncharacterized protein n=1 Tax=Furculomyces boomerangus TaxID=61424 RepID=A0A2T9Z5S1_9FUNG|nr:hypothetical protein BB559_000270 [Furculomyces boomerangus]